MTAAGTDQFSSPPPRASIIDLLSVHLMASHLDCMHFPCTRDKSRSFSCNRNRLVSSAEHGQAGCHEGPKLSPSTFFFFFFVLF